MGTSGDDSGEDQLLRLALELGAGTCGGPLSPAESRLVARLERMPGPDRRRVAEARAAIRAGEDPLGDQMCRLRPPVRRRRLGAFYTPPGLARPMVRWTLRQDPQRVVDGGCGSGRFAAAVVRERSEVEVVAIDIDPAATLLTRAALAALGARCARVLQADYTRVRLPRARGRTAFIGNPPYVRHHDLTPAAKRWFVTSGLRLGHRASARAGLHAHFFVATALHARLGDVGCLVTSSEWLDVGYGSVVRHLLAQGLGGRALHLVDRRRSAFAEAQTTALIACFEKGWRGPWLRLQMVDDPARLRDLDQGQRVATDRLAALSRWSRLWSPEGPVPAGMAPLGERARVGRGLVTGGNTFFVMTPARARELGIEAWCRPAISAAQEVIQAAGVIRDGPRRRVVLDLPRDFVRELHPAVDDYLRRGERAGDGCPPLARHYICAHRRPWWYLGRQEPAPVVATYMARQAPAFARNPDHLLVLNIAHGVYPREETTPAQLERWVGTLNRLRESFRGQGRTYQGGLEKFEPREMEALLVPAGPRCRAQPAVGDRPASVNRRAGRAGPGAGG